MAMLIEPDPTRIRQTGLGFFAAKALLSAVELGLFTKLARQPMTGAELARELGLSARAVPDFPDALVALKMLERDGDGADALYRNTVETDYYLDRAKSTYIGGILEMANARLYGFWGNLTEALKSGQPQNEAKAGESMFAKLYETPERLEQFMNAMAGASAANFKKFARTFDFSRYRTLCDVGGATGLLSILVAEANPHMSCLSYDLPAVKRIAESHIEAAGVAGRVQAVGGDFLSGSIPKADVITMGMILHDWNLEKKKMLIAKAFDALPQGGAFVVIETLIDDARRENAAGLLMSLNMLIEFGDAFDFTGADFTRWCSEAGFGKIDVMPLVGPSSAAIAYKR